MSIFGSSFSNGVISQLNLRQNAMFKRTPKFVQYTNSRNAWVRMVSSVNVNGSANIANYYALHGGILYNGNLRSGIGTSAQAYSTVSYGGADNKLGMRPMPGITSVEIKSKSAYGSVREVTVNFNCWDIKQLEDLELMYMRLGYTVLVEWGWNTSLKNENGDISFDIPSNVYKGVLAGSLDKEGIYAAIKNNSSTGNYDALFGKVQNYNWSARPDGGYDCSVSVISLGEILQSLKVNFSAATTSVATSGLFESGPFEKDSLVGKSYNQNVLAGMMAELFVKAVEAIPKSGGKVTTGNVQGYTLLRYDIEVLEGQKTNSAFADQGGGGAQIYIALKDFIELLNKYIILQVNKKPIVEISTKDPNGKELLCLGNILQLSIDPTICLIKNPVWADTSILNLPSDIKGLPNIINPIPLNYWQGDYKTNSLAITGNIYVNLEYIYSLVTNSSLEAQDKQEKNDISAYDFLKNLMSGISSAIGNVSTFEIYTDPLSSLAQIVDINYHGDVKYESLPKIQVQNTYSTVRTYKLESQIFNDQSTVIAIATQPEGGGSIGTNVTSLVAFNEGLKDRIIPAKTTSPSLPQAPNIEEKLKNIKENLSIIAKYTEDIKASWWESMGEFDAGQATKYANSLKDIIGAYKSLIADNGNNRAIIPTKLSLTMDGIGGIIIGNAFNIPDSALPKRYREKKVAYVVTGVNHSIQNNDWTTTIEAQTLLMMPPKGFPLQKFIEAQSSISGLLTNVVDKAYERIKSFVSKIAQRVSQAVEATTEVIEKAAQEFIQEVKQEVKIFGGETGEGCQAIAPDLSLIPDSELDIIKGTFTSNTGPVQDLAVVDGCPIARDVAKAFILMKRAAAKDKIDIRASSGFRSPYTKIEGTSTKGQKVYASAQDSLYRLYLAGKGNLAAKPMRSPHGFSVALDLNTGSVTNPGINSPLNKPRYQWLIKNAYKFGFVRYVYKEEWHWQYMPGTYQYNDRVARNNYLYAGMDVSSPCDKA
jgi:hypothetical protein